MGLYHKRPTVADIRALKGKRTLTMLYVDALGRGRRRVRGWDRYAVDHRPCLDPRDARSRWELLRTGRATIWRVGNARGLPACGAPRDAGGWRLRLLRFVVGTIKALADDGIPVVSHVGLIPSKSNMDRWLKAVGKTANSAMEVFRHVKALEEIGCFGVELEVVPDRVACRDRQTDEPRFAWKWGGSIRRRTVSFC